MKKVILLATVFSFIFTSCGSDDDATPTPTQNPIVGTWKYYKYFENDVEQTLDLCETEETLIFSADGSFSSSSYDEVTMGTCTLDETETGTWSSDNLSNYTIEAGGDSSTERIVFAEGGTFYFDGSYLDPDDNVIQTRDMYIKQ